MTIAGDGTEGFSGDGGPSRAARLRLPTAVASTADGALLVADTGNRRVRRLSAAGRISTVAGNGGYGYSEDGGPAHRSYLAPSALALDAVGNLYIAERDRHRVRRVARHTGLITTIAGNGLAGTAGDGGPAMAAEC